MKTAFFVAVLALCCATQAFATEQTYKALAINDVQSLNLVGCNVDVSLVLTDKEYVQIHATQRVIKRIKVFQKDKTLFIADTKQTGCATNSLFNRSAKIVIGVKHLESIEANSATQISISTGRQRLHIPELKLALNGMSKLSIKSPMAVEDLQISLNGTSKYDGVKLQANTVNVGTQGMSSAKIGIAKVLQASTNGMSSVTYTGEPKLTSLREGMSVIDQI